MTPVAPADPTSVAEVLGRFGAAVNRRDKVAVRDCLADGAVYHPSADIGETASYVGADNVVAGLFEFLAGFSAGRYEGIRKLHGCDYYVLGDGKIVAKSSFRKGA